MSLNTNNTQEPQVNNGGVNNNQNPMNAALGGNAGKGCFGLGKLGCAGIAILAALAMWVYSGYNGLVTQEEEVKTAWSQVENQYQRRIDLIKNVAASAKKYANTEKEIQLGTANARAHNNTANADQQMQAVAATADSLANVKMDPNEREVTVTLYHADLDTESLIESFAYAVGYIQSFMLHGFSENISE